MSIEQADRSDRVSGIVDERRASPVGVHDSPTASATRASKFNQFVQHFYSKAALLVVQARQSTSPIHIRDGNVKLNRWFNIETLETDAFREELKFWRSLDVPGTSILAVPPLVVEVVLVTRDLTANQTLVVVGRDGRRTDVEHGGSRHRQSINTIVLERWQIHWEQTASEQAPELPVAYKKSIAVFRALYTYTRLLPAWNLRKRLARSKLTGNSLKILCQIVPENSSAMASSRVSVSRPILPGQTDAVERFKFHKVEMPAGKLCISVEYRAQCDFRIDDSEALLSSQFMTNDQSSAPRPPSSLPSDAARRVNRQSSYSPLSASNNSMPYMATTEVRSSSQPRVDRRPSSHLLQPFKSPSLSASPSLDQLANSPRSIVRTPSSVSIDRTNSRMAGYPQSQRIPSSLGETSSLADDLTVRPQPPQMIKRYSSSFGQRSSSFSGRRRSSQISETVALPDDSALRSASRSPIVSRSTNTDEQELGDFVSLLDNRRPLAGSQFRDEGISSSRLASDSLLQKSQIDLGKFQRLKESHMTLSNSLLQSPMPRSSSDTTSRPIASPVLTHISLGSASPGKSTSPHTPAIPSRLSESSVMPRSKPRVEAARTTDIASEAHPGPPSSDATNAAPAAAQDRSESPILPQQRAEAQDAPGSIPRSYRTSTRLASRPSFSRARSDSSNASSIRRIQDSIAESPGESETQGFPSAERVSHEIAGSTSRPSERSRIPEAAPEDEDLFFAMSDIHFGAGRANEK